MAHLFERLRAAAVTAGLVAALLPVTGAPAVAQLPNPHAGSLGLGENFTALARGYASAAWNPAGLGMRDNPPSSFTILAAHAMAGLDPVSLADLKAYQGRTVPLAVREEWLESIEAAGRARGVGGGDLTLVSLTFANLGVQVGTSVRTAANLGPGAAELLLFGNGGRNDTADEVSFAGSSLDVLATSTIALAYAQPLVQEPGKSLAWGFTAKYILGHFVFSGQDAGSLVKSNPLTFDFQFPMVMPDTGAAYKLNKGAGLAMDFGLAYQEGPWSAGITLKNVVNRFRWNEAALSFRPGEAIFNSGAADSDFAVQEFSAAPATLQERVREMVGGKQMALGLAYRPGDKWLLSADIHRRSDVHLAESRTHLGAGIEVRPLRWLPLRAGGALLEDGHLAALGAGLEFGPLNLTASIAQRNTALGSGPVAMFGLSSMRTPPR